MKGVVTHGDVEMPRHKFGLKEPGDVDEGAEDGDEEDVLEDTKVHVFRSGSFSVGKWSTNCRKPAKKRGKGIAWDTFEKPFEGDADDEIDGATEGDIVEGEEKLWEEIGIQLTIKCEWPFVH